MARSMLQPWMVPLLALSLVLAPGSAAAEMSTEATSLNGTCSERLNAIWSKYSAPTTFPEGCDAACLAACHATLQDAVYADKARDCPLQDDIVRCFHVSDTCRWGSTTARCCPAATTAPRAVAHPNPTGTGIDLPPLRRAAFLGRLGGVCERVRAVHLAGPCHGRGKRSRGRSRQAAFRW